MRFAWFMSVMCGCWAASSLPSRDMNVLVIEGTDYRLESRWSVNDDINTTGAWRYGPGDTPVAEWNRDTMATVVRGHLQDRALLDVKTGDLLIIGTRASDSGVYTAVVNSIQTQKIDVSVISVVPVPTISWACQPADERMIFCVLTCEGDTSGAEPVQYSWSNHQANISNKGEDYRSFPSKSINFTMDAGAEVEFICTVWNTISLERSEPSTRPSTLRETLHPMKGVIVFISFIVAVIAAITLHRCWTGVWFFHKESVPWQSDFWRRRRNEGGDDPENNRPKELEELNANPEMKETEH